MLKPIFNLSYKKLTEADDSGSISKLERPKTTLANAGRKRLSEESIGQPGITAAKMLPLTKNR